MAVVKKKQKKVSKKSPRGSPKRAKLPKKLKEKRAIKARKPAKRGIEVRTKARRRKTGGLDVTKAYRKVTKAKAPIVNAAKQMLSAIPLTHSGYTPLQSNPTERYAKTIKTAISGGRLEPGTLDRVAQVLYGARHSLRDRFTARLRFISNTGEDMGECELIGVLAEDAEFYYSDLIGQHFTSHNSLQYHVELRATAMHEAAKLTGSRIPPMGTGTLAKIEMDYTFA